MTSPSAPQRSIVEVAQAVLNDPERQHREDFHREDARCDGCDRERPVVARWWDDENEPWLCQECDELAQREPRLAVEVLALLARLTAVEALCDEWSATGSRAEVPEVALRWAAERVRSAARGES